MGRGLKREEVLRITGITRHQLYYRTTGGKAGRPPSETTRKRDRGSGLIVRIDNADVVARIRHYRCDPDHAHYYKSITVSLCLEGFYINHKKVYRLMKAAQLLQPARRAEGRNFVKFRRVCPLRPLRILEMDIKYYWVEDTGRYAFVLTILDTFTRYVLAWLVGYEMRQQQVRQCWEYVIANYLQGLDLREEGGVHIEVRNDNGKQFSAKMVQEFFAQNYLEQVFTHPYTPEENGHVESFHKTIGKATVDERFATLDQLEARLRVFYTNYNNLRLHGSIAMLSPAYFWALFEQGLIEVTEKGKRRLRFKLKIPYQQVRDQPDIEKYFQLPAQL